MHLATFLLLLSAPQEADYYTLEHLVPPDGEVLEVGGMDFLSDGTLLVSTRRGRVWWIENAMADDVSEARFHIYADGLHEGLGLRVVEDVIHVVQRGELSRLLDLDGDKRCDRIETVSQDWGMTGNYHEFAFGAPVDEDGAMLVSTNVGFWSPEWWHGKSAAKHRGWILKVHPDGRTEAVASGARSPAGLGKDGEGRLYFTDNQGDWMPVCGVFHIRPDAFFGHPASLRWTKDYGHGVDEPSSLEPPQREPDAAAIWLPYEWSRSAGNLVTDHTDGKFGPFAGQQFMAELTNGKVLRMMMEEVEGQVQGAVLPFRSGVGSAFRVRFAPDGSLFAGFTNRGWGGLAPGHGLARLRWSGKLPREILDIRVQPDGFLLRFTEPLAAAPELSDISIRAYDYNWWWDYGSPEMRSHAWTPTAAELSEDGRELRLRVDGIEPGWAVRVQLQGLGLLHDTFDYTLNRLPGSPAPEKSIAVRAEPPQARESEERGWLTLTWQDPFDAWNAEGWKLVDVDLHPDDPSRFLEAPGNGALVNTGEGVTDFISKAEFGDIEFRFSFMLPQGGDSGLYFQDRYELQLVDDPNQCCGVLGGKGPRAKGYRGPGQWHIVRGRFYAPRFDGDGNKTANARFEEITVDGLMVIGSTEVAETTGGAHGGSEVTTGPLKFQANAGLVAMGDVRVRLLAEEPSATEQKWIPLEEWQGPLGDFELRGSIHLNDGGAAAIDFFRGAEQDGLRLILNHTGPGEERSGSIRGHAPLRTQFLNPGVPFDLKLRAVRMEQATRCMVWLNGVMVNQVDVPGVLPDGAIELVTSLAPGTEFHAEDVQVQSLRK